MHLRLILGAMLVLSGLPLWKIASSDDLFENPAITEHWLGQFAMQCLFVLTCTAMAALPMIGVYLLAAL
jgi:hypothetical protein